MSSILPTLQQSPWIQRLFILVLICNIVLILWGIHVVPAIVSTLGGVARVMADIGLQVVIGVLALLGPFSFQRYRATIWISLLFGLLFAVAYDGIVLLEYVGLHEEVNVFLLFVGAASLAGFIGGYQTRRFGQGVIAATWALLIGTAIWSTGVLVMHYAYWGSHQAYIFWQNDGAIEQFHHSGMSDLALFLMQDVQGALFFHPLLSAVTGAICGLLASGLAQGVHAIRLARKPNLR